MPSGGAAKPRQASQPPTRRVALGVLFVAAGGCAIWLGYGSATNAVLWALAVGALIVLGEVVERRLQQRPSEHTTAGRASRRWLQYRPPRTRGELLASVGLAYAAALVTALAIGSLDVATLIGTTIGIGIVALAGGLALSSKSP